MKKVESIEEIHLKDAIVPQHFAVCDDAIFYFDKLNQHEGRFCYQKNNRLEIICEIDNIQGIVLPDGSYYTMSIGDTTKIVEFESDKHKTLELHGMFYDFRKDDLGNFLCIGYLDQEPIIRIINKKGQEIGTIRPAYIKFGGCIYNKDDSIYIAGFENLNEFKIIKMNYVGNIESTWNIKSDTYKRVINKIEIYKDCLYALVSGKYDSLIIIETNSNKFYEILPQNIGLTSFVDFVIKKDKLFILDRNKIFTFNPLNLKDKKMKKKFFSLKGINTEVSLYTLFIYNNQIKKRITQFYKVNLVVISILYFLFIKSINNISEKIIISFSMFWILNFFAAIIGCSFGLSNKTRRIEELLDANVYHSSKLYGIYNALALYSFGFILFYPELKLTSIALSCTVILLIIYSIKTHIDKSLCEKNSELVVQLLYDDDTEVNDYIKRFVEKIKEKSIKTICVSINSNEIIKAKDIKRWAESRKNIIRADIIYDESPSKMKIILDFSKRDLRYSYFSIIMDCVCYLRNKISINEIKMYDADNDMNLLKDIG